MNSQTKEREKLMMNLLDAVKQCQIRFGGQTELATELDSRVSVLCSAWGNIFQHGLRCNNLDNKAISTLKQLTYVAGLKRLGSKMNILEDMSHNHDTESVFWNYVKEQLSHHELQRFMSLRNVKSDVGRSLAWLRASLNEHSLERYIHMMISSEQLLCYYENYSFLRDEEKANLLPNMAAGLGSILFAINIDNASLNGGSSLSDVSIAITPPALMSSNLNEGDIHPKDLTTIAQGELKKERRRKKKTAKIVTFDTDDLSLCSAFPVSSFISPVDGIQIPSNDSTKTTTSEFNLPLEGEEEEEGPTSSLLNHDFDDKMQKFVFERRNDSKEGFKDSLNEENRLTVDDRNGFESEQLSERQTENAGKASSQLVSYDSALANLGNVNDSRNRNNNDSILNSNKDFEKEIESLENFSMTSEISEKRNIDRKIGMNFNEKKKLIHSTSDASMTSSVLSSHQLLTFDASSEVSLVPLNSDGRPIELDGNGGGGDTTSESYGSYDSREMLPPYNIEMIDRATHAVGEAERALNNSLDRYLVSTCDNSSIATTLSYDELKEALVAMMLRKDDAEDRNRRLQVALDAERESVTSLHQEIEEKRRAELDRLEKNGEKNRTLMRENELLKNQLKKYVSAVQMLRLHGASVDAIPGLHLDSSLLPIIPPERSSIDYSYEAEEYEKKLIQVAEMHGELMEFNELLQRQLVIREIQVKHLKEELINLRGPLPNEIHSREIDLVNSSSGGSSSNISISISGSALINIWIPSAFLRGSSKESYHVYQVYVHIRNEEWNIYRRYAEFFELHSKLKKKYQSISSLDFPPKKPFGKKDPKIVEIRRKKLETYLRQIVKILTEMTKELAENPSRQTLIHAVPFFSDELKIEKSKQKSSRRSRERSVNHSSVNHSLSSDATTEPNDEHEHQQQYMGL